MIILNSSERCRKTVLPMLNQNQNPAFRYFYSAFKSPIIRCESVKSVVGVVFVGGGWQPPLSTHLPQQQ